MTGGQNSTHGTPQGGVISPLLANLYIHRFLKFWRMQEKTQAYRAHIVSYADDLVTLSCGHAGEALAWTRGVMTRLGLTINEAKTSVKDARKARFDILGFTFGPLWRRRDGKRYLGYSPSKKSVGRIKHKIGDLLVPGNQGSWDDVRDRLNRLLRGWSGYFSHGTLSLEHFPPKWTPVWCRKCDKQRARARVLDPNQVESALVPTITIP